MQRAKEAEDVWKQIQTAPTSIEETLRQALLRVP